jgi:hypothetical protein
MTKQPGDYLDENLGRSGQAGDPVLAVSALPLPLRHPGAEIRSSRMAATDRLLRLNAARGYRSFRMMPNAGLLETTGYDVPYHPDTCNYLFVPEERVAEVIAATG